MRKPKKLPPIKTWTEPIDASAYAALASCFEVRGKREWVWETGHGGHIEFKRYLYGLAVFVIVDPEKHGGRYGYRAHDVAREVLTKEIAERHGGRLPYFGPAE